VKKNYQSKQHKSNQKFEVVGDQELMVRVPLPMAEVWAELQAQVEELTGQAGLQILRAILENEVTHRVGPPHRPNPNAGCVRMSALHPSLAQVSPGCWISPHEDARFGRLQPEACAVNSGLPWRPITSADRGQTAQKTPSSAASLRFLRRQTNRRTRPHLLRPTDHVRLDQQKYCGPGTPDRSADCDAACKSCGKTCGFAAGGPVKSDGRSHQK
jgi:hypothetical protein